jgi:predicted nicotinamide N-methyase
MKDLKKHKEIFRLQELEVQLWVPDLDVLQLTYQKDDSFAGFPYWAKLWPSAYVLTAFMHEHRDLVKNQKVLELAAGLGLPSLFASKFASSVICSDHDASAVQFIQLNIALNNCANMICEKIDWTQLPTALDFDLLMVSDINYDPENFETLKNLFQKVLANGKTILLSTPQRLAGKAFIAELLPWCILNEERWHEQTPINVLVLKKQ